MTVEEMIRQIQYQQRALFDAIGDAITQALAPFKPHPVTYWLDENFKTGKSIMIEVGTLPVFKMALELGRMTAYPYEFTEEIAKKAYEHFASIYVEPEDNIHLGEN